MIRNAQYHFPAGHRLSGHNAYPSAKGITVIPAFLPFISAKAGIHRIRRPAPPTTIYLLDYV